MTDAGQRFFISYAGLDRPWAEWVGWHLERAGHQVILDVWDWSAGDNFVQRMEQALERADAVVALLSTSYFDRDRWTEDERTAALARRDRIIPLALEPLSNAGTPPLLASKIRKNLHGLDEAAAIAVLREAVNGGARRTSPPPFPGDAPAPEADASATRPRLPTPAGHPGVRNLRRRNPDFSGREALLAQLRDGLLSGRQAVVQAVHGMGGIGKTQIALEYAHRFADQYDVVWWVDAEQADQVPVHYTELAHRLGIAKPDAGAEPNARALLQHLRGGERRWLIVLDNAEDPDQIEPWLPEGPGHVLITSRNPDWHRIAHQTGLDVFTRSDSLAYLRTRVPGIPAEQADVLAQDLGDLPLALAQAAGVIGSGMTVDRYRQLLTTNTASILRKATSGYAASLAAAVGIAAGRLDDDHPEATALLRLGAFFGPDPIPTGWLENARPELTTIPGDPDDVMWPRDALHSLSRYGLARVDHESFQIHRLTQAVLRDRTGPEQVGRIRDDLVTLLCGVDPGAPDAPEAWPRWAPLASHLTAGHAVSTERPELRPILLKAAFFLLMSGQPRSAYDLTAALRRSWEAELGPDHPDTLTCMQYLGHATADLGDISGALPVVEDTYVRRRRILGDDHPDTLQSANDLAAVLARAGKIVTAHRMDEDTFARRRRVLGEDHPDTLQSAHNLSGALYSRGDYAEARRMDEDTLARRRRVLGEGHIHTLQSALSLATCLNSLGEYVEARRMHEDVLARRRRVLGEDHPDTLWSGHNLASTLFSLGERVEARRMEEDNLARRRRVLGEDHPDTLWSTHNLAGTLYSLGEHVEARRMTEDVLSRRRRILGEDHPDTLSSAHDLAVILHNIGEYEEARLRDEDTLARRRRILGEDHPHTLRTLHNLGVDLQRLRSYPEAVELLEDVRARRRRVLGDEHPETMSTTGELANTLAAMGKRFAAQRLLSKQQKQAKRRAGRKRR
ncbi:FxSxx-COOH system tetratricopeptide repeat protein [Streptomyces sp. ISL-11]|uniref:FxSxx-COOH system tetratricopeptide repeat protein n=1 Tax=Streptomyces sp. ISL-11 TaxID=2819174 RepID=UPI001BED0F32|nr:FxSxx-COOH system tetratricopeptide repeat protein [Streptomyces sp. ISL-11]MBT2384254.1 tetratricopeptide repeat protein [Streptomyces sp. ISL-11]